jgi:alkyl hydroperoxide reductase subunit F
MYDVAIVGAGPGGLTAAVYAARKQLAVVMITMDIGGQTNLSADVENYMGFDYISGNDLAEKFHEQVEQFPITNKLGTLVRSLERAGDHFDLVTTDDETLQTRTVIISTGKTTRKLGVPGEAELRGRGVSYCSTCDGPFFKGQDVLVVGAGNSGVSAAIDLSRVARAVTVAEELDHAKADEILLEQARAAGDVFWLFGHRVLDIQGKTGVESVTLEAVETGERRELPVTGIFVEIGLVPTTEWLHGFLKLDQWGQIIVDGRAQTNEPGVFAAGDVTDGPYKQIIVAAGDGAKAALAAYDYLLSQGLVRPVRSW